jgi:hypothetical protein
MRPLLLCILLLALGGCDEYREPTVAEKAQAAAALKRIPDLEERVEQNYFDPRLHFELASAYAWAFAGNTDNSVYFERTISESVVSLRLRDDPPVLTYLRQAYTAYHANKTPKNRYTPTGLSFELWYRTAQIFSPDPDNVRLIVDARNELDSLYARYLTAGPPDDAVLALFRGTRASIHLMFQFATARAEIRIPGRDGLVIFNRAAFREWGTAIHRYAFASQEGLTPGPVYDTLPPDAVLITGGENSGHYRVAPNLLITLGMKYFEATANARWQSRAGAPASPSDFYRAILRLRDEGLSSAMYDMIDPTQRSQLMGELRRGLAKQAPDDRARARLSEMDDRALFELILRHSKNYPTDILSEEIDGDLATLTLLVHQDPDPPVEKTVLLHKVSDEWKLVWQ